MLDYLIVGSGLAGISFAERLEANTKSFKVMSDGSQQASLVAGGLYNPIILKRFTLAWKADQQLKLLSYYDRLEKKLQVKLDHKIPVLRRFASIEEQNLWFEAADRPILDQLLCPTIFANTNPQIDAPFGFGRVEQTGRVATDVLLRSYVDFLKNTDRWLQESFDYKALEVTNTAFAYKGLKFKKIVFAEGFGLQQNPFFDYLPLTGTKGELLTIKAEELNETSVIKSSVFIIPLGNHLYRLGATYKWKDKTNIPTQASKEELLQKVRTFLKCDFEVVRHVAGVRPTVTDRRPLVGGHPKYQGMYVLNGFGSRGVLIAPYAAAQLYLYSERGVPIDPEMDSGRFDHKLPKAIF